MGRPRIDILMPGQEFTTADLKRQNPFVSAFVIQRNLRDWLLRGEVRRAGTVSHRDGGKAFYLYQATNSTTAPALK